MGLDVYLKRCENLVAHQLWERKQEAAHEENWNANGKTFNQLTHAERDTIARWNANWDAENPDPFPETSIEIDSTIDPSHMFKIGYFRSSYNDGGIESVVDNAIGICPLEHIFQPEDRYDFKPDWQQARIAAAEMIERYSAHIAESGGVKIHCADHNSFLDPQTLPSSAADAMSKYVAQAGRSKGSNSDFNSFSNSIGHFYFGKPMSVRAIIPGTRKSFDGAQPCQYVVYQPEYSEKEDWYLTAIKIVLETIDWVLAQPDPENYLLHWSG